MSVDSDVYLKVWCPPHLVSMMASIGNNDVREREQRLVYLITYSRADLEEMRSKRILFRSK